MIAQDTLQDFNKISNLLEDLVTTAATYQSHDIVCKMKIIVPEFKSLNSEFEILDTKN